jgi:hypothetical protein
VTDAGLSSVDNNSDVALHPEGADPQAAVVRKIPSDIIDRYEVYSYKNAAVIALVGANWPGETPCLAAASRNSGLQRAALSASATHQPTTTRRLTRAFSSMSCAPWTCARM